MKVLIAFDLRFQDLLVDEWMDGWRMDGWNGWMDGWMVDGWWMVDGLGLWMVDGGWMKVSRLVGGWMDGWMDCGWWMG